MKLIGMNYTTNQNGTRFTTLHLTDEFEAYYNNHENGRSCVGLKSSSVYVGDFDCSALKLGMEIDILYDRAITTAKGTFQPIKRIDIVSK